MPSALFAATNDLSGLLQRGLFEEEANRNLDAASAAYQTLVTQLDKDRQIGATAVFRLGEVYRKQGKTNEAVAQYERIVRDFADQTTLATLSRQNLTGLKPAPSVGESQTFAERVRKNQDQQRADYADADVAQLKKLSREDLLQVLPTLAPDSLLTKLQEQLNTSEVEMIKLKSNLGPYHPDVASLAEQIKVINKQIDNRTRGILAALELRKGAVAKAESFEKPANTPLVDANGNLLDEDAEIRRLQTLIQNSPDLINGSAGGESPLYAAAWAGRLRVATFLLDNGADVNRVSLGHTPLHRAVQSGHKAMIELLLKRGAEVNAKDNTGGTALHQAAQSGFLSIVEVLLKYKADLNARNSKNNGEQSPLHLAVQNGHTTLVGYLLEHGDDANRRDARKQTPLHIAAIGGKGDVLERLLKGGADIEAQDEREFTALMHVAWRGHSLAVGALLAAKSNPDRTDQGGQTALIIACRKGHRDSVRALLDAKANPNVVDKSGRTALSYAVESGHAEIAGVLLEAKANPNAGISDAPLLLAVRVDNPVMAEVLLRAGADANQMTECVYVSMNSSGGVPIPAPGVSVSGIESTGRQSLRTRSVSMGRRVKQTPLQAAVLEEYPAMVKLLLQFKGDPHAKSPDGSSLLLGALRFETAAKAFLEAGADPNCKDANGDAALIVASKNGFFDAIEPLLKHGSDVNVRGQKGDTALLNAASTMNLKTIGVLLDYKADVNAANVNGWTPLHAVVWTGNKEVIELLLKRGAAPNVRDSFGMTPLDMAKAPKQRAGAANNITPAPTDELVALLRKYGALDVLPDFKSIQVRRPSVNYSAMAFAIGTNGWNEFKLLEVLALQYGFVSSETKTAWTVSNAVHPREFWGQAALSFPDLKRLVVRRPAGDGQSWQNLEVDAAGLLDSGDRGRDVRLQPGDIVEIPEADHPVDQKWSGFTSTQLSNLLNCVSRTVTIVIKGAENRVPLEFDYQPGNTFYGYGERGYGMTKGSFMLMPVLWKSGLVRASSDLSRVKVTRKQATGKQQEWVIDCSGANGTFPDLWLQDGDVIEVPDKL